MLFLGQNLCRTESKYAAAEPNVFIRETVREDIASGKYKAPVTRFPPEPNGYLHIGHANPSA